MAKKITISLDEDIVSKIDELSRKTNIPKARLTHKAYELLLAMYKKLNESYSEDIVNINLINFINKGSEDK